MYSIRTYRSAMTTALSSLSSDNVIAELQQKCPYAVSSLAKLVSSTAEERYEYVLSLGFFERQALYASGTVVDCSTSDNCDRLFITPWFEQIIAAAHRILV